MNKHLFHRGRWAVAALVLASLAGCWDGGGDDDSPPPPTALSEIPDSALVSATAYTEFALGLETSETAEPFSVDKVSVAPSDDASEPIDFD